MSFSSRPITHRLSYHHYAALALALFAFFMSALISRSVFERLPHLEDEVAYLFQAKVFARGRLTVETPQPRRAFWQPFVVDYPATGQRFAKYTPGWPAVLALGVLLGQTWVVNAWLAALNVALVYRLGRALYSADVGLIAAALMAFSPMALLLNASLMGHTAALFFSALFLAAYLQLERGGRRAMRWAALAGLALGMVLIMRPLTAFGLALPFILWSTARLAYTLRHARPDFWPQLKPLLVLAALTLLVGLAIPIYNAAATGDPMKNLYTLVWEYDRIGFGECCGRSGHTLQRALNHMRWDLSWTAADLFGWQWQGWSEAQAQHVLTRSDYMPALGLSWALLPGLALGFLWARRQAHIAFAALWVLGLIAWVVIPYRLPVNFISDFAYIPYWWLWLGVGVLWIAAPLFYNAMTRQPRRVNWLWLMMASPVALVGAQLTYWIGSQRYSTRYYFEALPALALLSAIGLGWLARRRYLRWPLYALLAIALLVSLYGYSTPRISALRHFNAISRADYEGLQARREDERPLLVFVRGVGGANVRWRAFGSLLPFTSPFLDGDLVVAWDYADGVREQVSAQFPDRAIIEMEAMDNFAWFLDEPCTIPPPDASEVQRQEYAFCLQRPSIANPDAADS